MAARLTDEPALPAADRAQSVRDPVGLHAVNPRVVRVLPDVAAINKEFDYLVPDALGDQVRIGTMVRIPLHGRRVGGWVVADRVEPVPGIVLRPLAKVTGWGPAPDLIDLAGWAAWRWAGRRPALLTTASPDHAVRGLPASTPALDWPQVWERGRAGPDRSAETAAPAVDAALIADAFGSGGGKAILRLPPAADLLPVVLAGARLGPTLVVTPSAATAGQLANRLRRLGAACALLPGEWAQAAAGAPVVLGARSAAWAPCPGLAAVVVLDGHDEALQQEQAPTWNAWMVAAERARRANVPCVVVSPCPTTELLAWPGAALVVPSRGRERAGWAGLEVLDRRRDDPRTGLYSPRVVALVRGDGRVVCVLNRKGRARLMACSTCAEPARCERCAAAVSQTRDGDLAQLTCARCGLVRPVVCLSCGSSRLKALRIGVTRAREELEALAGQPVGEVTADTATLPDVPILVGTEAVLHRVGEADGVAFLDFDQELLAPRYRAAEEAMALLSLASRVVGGRRRGGRVLVQTRLPHHDVLVAAVTADPRRVTDTEVLMRQALRLPPAVPVALISGEAAPAFVADLSGVEVLGPDHGHWLVKGHDHQVLSAALAAVGRPPGRLRIEVDPLRF